MIGRDNDMPWRLPADLKHFRARTMGKPVVMGRKTYRSIGRPLAGRTTIVASRDPAFAAPRILVAPSLEQALAVARGEALRRGVGEIMLAGGGDIYAQAMPLADRLEITHVQVPADGDARFPPIERALWREVSRQELAARDGEPVFAWVTYERIHADHACRNH